MRVIYFKITGLNREEIERLRKNRRTTATTETSRTFSAVKRLGANLSPLPKLAVFLMVAIVTVHAIQLLSDSGKSSTDLEGVSVSGTNVIAIIDVSGSMADEQRQQKLEKLKNRLLTAGMSVQEVDVQGFGFADTWLDSNQPTDLEKALQKNPESDLLFVFSDFEDQDVAFDNTVAPAYARLRQLLQKRGARLYLATVSSQDPPAGLVQIANDFRGDVIHLNPATITH